MGAIYRPMYRDRQGVIQQSEVWWVRFRQHGQTIRQSTETTSEAKARAFLREREGKVALHLPVTPGADRLTLAEAVDLIRSDYLVNGRKSRRTLEYPLAHLQAHFGPAARLGRLTTGHVEAYKAARLAAGVKPATINRELAALGRMAALCRHQYGLHVPFVVKKFEERNVRTGFFEAEAFRAVCQHLQPELGALATVAILTGWRKWELLSRQWRHVDFTAGWLRLEPEETKNRDGRMFPLIPELRAVLETQRGRVEAMQRAMGRVIPWVFVRDDGRPVGDFKKAWRTAKRRAGVPGHVFHDFRRTAVRNLIRAGIPETVAMKLTGHRTRSVFTRYCIVEEGMLKEAGARLAAGGLAGDVAKTGPKVARSLVLDR
jgi:integrase